MRIPLRLVLPATSALLALILVLAIVRGVSSNGSSNSSPGGSGASASADGSDGLDGAVLPAGARAPGFTLTDQRGHATSLGAFRGRVVVLAFLDSDPTCRACVLVAQQVRGALDELASAEGSRDASVGGAQGVQTIFVSSDPRADTPASVGRFLSETSLSGRVAYLSGDPAALAPVWHAYDIPPASARDANAGRGASAVQPATSVMLIDRDGFERIELGVEQLTPESLAHDLRRLQAG